MRKNFFLQAKFVTTSIGAKIAQNEADSEKVRLFSELIPKLFGFFRN